jgi:uncharacterized protein YndB with AHSA1/START domain
MPALEPAPAVSTIMLTQSRVIRAPRASVYQAWANPEVLKQWFGPAAMFLAAVSLDVRVGGTYRIEMQMKPDAPPEARANMSQQALVTGTYTQIVPNELLQFTWEASWSPSERSLVTISLRDITGGTELTLRQEKFDSEQSRDAHKQGWSRALDNLTAALES